MIPVVSLLLALTLPLVVTRIAGSALLGAVTEYEQISEAERLLARR